MSDDPIARYLAHLDRSLRGRPNRQRLVEEAEDHLRESEADLRTRGLTQQQAGREAVRRLGSADSLAHAGGGRIATAVVLVLGVAAMVALLISAVAVSGPGQDGPTPGFPMYLLFGGIGVGVITVSAVVTVRTWASGVATRGAVVRMAILTVALIVAVGLGMLAVHEGKHQQGGSLAEREQRVLAVLAIAAGVIAIAVWLMELHARREQQRLDGEVS